MRLSTPAHERLDVAQSFEIAYSGAETVVAVTLAQMGESVAFATKIASNQLGTNALMMLARHGIDISRVMRSNDRMGIHYTERGLSIRPSVVTYDRSDTAMANAKHTDFDWDRMLNGVEVFFFSGVEPAISEEIHLACLEGLRACKGRGIKTVMDLNYRETMWPARDVARKKIGALLPYIDLLIASEDDIISYDGGVFDETELFDCCLAWARGMMMDFSLGATCVVVRQTDRYDVASIRGALVGRKGSFFSKSQQVSIADSSSTGSVFAAAVVHGQSCRWDEQFLIDYATMASAFKATIVGDYSSATETEIASLLASGVKPHIRQ